MVRHGSAKAVYDGSIPSAAFELPRDQPDCVESGISAASLPSPAPGPVARSAYTALFESFHGCSPPRLVTLGESAAGLLSPGRGFMGGFDWTMQLQVGCPGGCLFCYVPSGPRLAPLAVRGANGERWGFEVRTKARAIEMLRRHLERGDLADRTVYWSGVTDPYAASPAMTRTLWEVLSAAPVAQRPRRIAVQTRFHADRDAERMAEYAAGTRATDQGPPVLVSLSLGTDRQDLIDAWERATPGFAQRMAAIRSLRDSGIFVVATLSPFAFWNDLTGTLARLREWGVAYVTLLFFKHGCAGANTPRLFLQYLRREHPELLDPAWQAEQLATVESVFGAGRVLTGREGFASLAAPHRVLEDLTRSGRG